MIEPARTDEAKAALVAYLASKLGTTPGALVGDMPFEVVAVLRDGHPRGAVLYFNYRRGQATMEMACAGEPGWLSRGSLHQLFAYPFVRNNIFTVLTTVQRSNKVARAFNAKLGFVELCAIPCGRRDDDVILYGMTRNQCPWIETASARSAVKTTANGADTNG